MGSSAPAGEPDEANPWPVPISHGGKPYIPVREAGRIDVTVAAL
jgi:hypothetical protein